MEQTSRGGLRQHISRKHREQHRLAKEKAKLVAVGELTLAGSPLVGELEEATDPLVVIGPVQKTFPFQENSNDF